MGTYSGEPATEHLKWKITYERGSVSFEQPLEPPNDDNATTEESAVIYDGGPQENHGSLRVINDEFTSDQPAAELGIGARGQALEATQRRSSNEHGVIATAPSPESGTDAFTFFIRFKYNEEDRGAQSLLQGRNIVTTYDHDATVFEGPSGFSIDAIPDDDRVRVGMGTDDDHFLYTHPEPLGDGEWHWIAMSTTTTDVFVMVDGDVVFKYEYANEMDWVFDEDAPLAEQEGFEDVYMMGTINSVWDGFSQTHDEVRLYDGVQLTPEQLRDIASLAEHGQVDNIGDVWPTPGMPYISGEGNARFAGTLGTPRDYAYVQLDETLFARHIDDAAGAQLDRIGALPGVRRRSGEGDATYRIRIKAAVFAGRSSGTFEDILRGLRAILSADEGGISLERGWEYDEDEYGTVRVFIDSQYIDATPLSSTDLNAFTEDLIMGGHRARVFEGNPPFTLSDGTSNDPDLGLSTSGFDGGNLVEEL